MRPIKAGYVHAVAGVLFLACASVSNSVQGGKNNAVISADVPAPVAQFYRGRRFCSVGHVSQVEMVNDDVVVDVRVDERWAKTLANKGENLRRDWFSIHCPRHSPGVWSSLQASGDIVIRGVLPERGEYLHGCRHNS